MIVFDLFLKKSNGSKKDEETNFVVEGFETQDVEMTDQDLEIERKIEGNKNNTLEEENDEEEEPEPVKPEGIEFEIQGQGFTTDELAAMLHESHQESGGFMDRLNARSIEQSNNQI